MPKQTIHEQDIIEAGKKLLKEKGLSSITMRSVADACHIAVGSLYNYYPSKGYLLIAIMTSIWTDIAHYGQDSTQSFIQTVQRLYINIAKGNQEYPLFFFWHYEGFTKDEKKVLHHQIKTYQTHTKKHLRYALLHDAKIDVSRFDDTFTIDAFIDFVLDNMISLWMHNETNCLFLLRVIKRLIYIPSKGESHESEY